MESGLLDKLVSSITLPPRSLPPRYLDFVRHEVSSLFRKGWDATYESHCLVTSPPLSSVTTHGRREGGCLGAMDSLCTQSEFLDCVLKGEGDIDRLEGELLVVQSAGKPRPLTKFEASSLSMKPLHKTIYSHLKRTRWLLTGDPTREKLSKAGFRRGKGVLVSGDYASATDGLSIEVAEVILDTLLRSSVFVPQNVKAAAVRALRPILRRDLDPKQILDGVEEEFEVTTGQMMGSYLSFPLLCLQNYLAFRWSLRGTGLKYVPLLINGDDILFQLDGHFDRWQSCLAPVGLTVEPTKTSVEDNWGTINSTLLEWRGEFLEPAWSARFGMFRPAEHPESLGRSFLSFLRGLNEADLRFRAGREFFKWHVSELRSAGCSLVSLGFRGLLARRLAKLFSLLELPSCEFPRAFDKHKVGYDADFIARHDLDALGPEELFQSSLELGSQKWANGFRPAVVSREALRYCLSRSAVKGSRFDYPVIPSWTFSSLSEFRFGLRNAPPSVGCKPVKSKEFLLPFPPRVDVLVSLDVLWSLGSWWQDPTLPAYEEIAEVAW